LHFEGPPKAFSSSGGEQQEKSWLAVAGVKIQPQAIDVVAGENVKRIFVALSPRGETSRDDDRQRRQKSPSGAS
jgi:hypothetical protein